MVATDEANRKRVICVSMKLVYTFLVLLSCCVFAVGLYIMIMRDQMMIRNAERENWNTVRWYIEVLKANPNAMNADGYTALWYAVFYGSRWSTGMLLECGSDTKVQCGPAGDTPLHVAAGKGDRLLVDLLLSKRADINANNKLGYTPLWSAAIGSPSMFYYLLSKGAHLEGLKHPRFGNLLHFAACNRYQDTAFLQYIISLGCDPFEKDADGETCFDEARAAQLPVTEAFFRSLEKKEDRQEKDR